jgi:hypothetical protein
VQGFTLVLWLALAALLESMAIFVGPGEWYVATRPWQVRAIVAGALLWSSFLVGVLSRRVAPAALIAPLVGAFWLYRLLNPSDLPSGFWSSAFVPYLVQYWRIIVIASLSAIVGAWSGQRLSRRWGWRPV